MTVGRHKQQPLRPYINLILTMIIIGFWHGANWTFIVFGLYHGIGMVLLRFRRPWWRGGGDQDDTRSWKRIARGWINIIVTLNVVAISTVLFRASDLSNAMDVYGSMVSAEHWGMKSFLPRLAIMILVIGAAIQLSRESFRAKFEAVFLRLPAPILALVILLIFGLVAIFTQASNPFIYFQF